MMISQSLQRLSTRLLRYERAQSDVATGKRIRTPSDDAAEVFGPTPTDGGVFARLDEAAAGIRAGDTTAGTDAIAAMDEAIRLVSDSQARIGANTNWVESAHLRGQEVLQAIRVELSEVEDVDLAEAMMDLQTQQVAYEATLRALARALPPSLVTFLS